MIGGRVIRVIRRRAAALVVMVMSTALLLHRGTRRSVPLVVRKREGCEDEAKRRRRRRKYVRAISSQNCYTRRVSTLSGRVPKWSHQVQLASERKAGRGEASRGRKTAAVSQK